MSTPFIATSDDIDRLAGVPSLYELVDKHFAIHTGPIEQVSHTLGLEQGMAMIVAGPEGVAANAGAVQRAMIEQAVQRLRAVNIDSQMMEDAAPLVSDIPLYYLAKPRMVANPPAGFEEAHALASKHARSPGWIRAQAAQDASLWARDMMLLAGPNPEEPLNLDVRSNAIMAMDVVKAMKNGHERGIAHHVQVGELEDMERVMDKVAFRNVGTMLLPGVMPRYEHYCKATLAGIRAGLESVRYRGPELLPR